MLKESYESNNTYFKHESLHKYTCMPTGQDGVEITITIDLVLVKKDMVLMQICSESNGTKLLRSSCCIVKS